MTEEDEAALRALVARMSTSWDRNDAEAYSAAFTDDSDYVAFDGTRQLGRAANAEAHRRLFAGVLAGSRLVQEVESIRQVSPDVAVVHLVGAVLLPWQDRPHPRRMSRQTVVAVRGAAGWRFSAFHNSRIRPLPTDGPFLALITRVFRLRAAFGGRRIRGRMAAQA